MHTAGHLFNKEGGGFKGTKRIPQDEIVPKIKNFRETTIKEEKDKQQQKKVETGDQSQAPAKAQYQIVNNLRNAGAARVDTKNQPALTVEDANPPLGDEVIVSQVCTGGEVELRSMINEQVYVPPEHLVRNFYHSDEELREAISGHSHNWDEQLPQEVDPMPWFEIDSDDEEQTEDLHEKTKLALSNLKKEKQLDFLQKCPHVLFVHFLPSSLKKKSNLTCKPT